MSKELLDLSLMPMAKTEKALGVSDGVTKEKDGKLKVFWLPLSQIEIEPPDFKYGKVLTVTLPEWLAIEKGLV